MKIIYICGLGHSGSTILDLVLGAHSGVIGLGEINRLLKAEVSDFSSKDFTEILCSCGNNMDDCMFWSEVKKNVLKTGAQSVISRYDQLLRIFQSIYGVDKILVDSSKTITPYLLDLKKKHDLRIIFLARDFRSWSFSISLKSNRKMATLPLRWKKGNNRLLSFLDKNSFDYFNLGYEEFALYPDRIIPELCAYLDIEFEKGMLSPASSSSHIIRGNTGRGDPEKRTAISYDARWMTSIRSAMISFLYFPMLSYNNKIVFSNFIQSKIKNGNQSGKDFMIFNNENKQELLKNKWGHPQK